MVIFQIHFSNQNLYTMQYFKVPVEQFAYDNGNNVLVTVNKTYHHLTQPLSPL